MEQFLKLNLTEAQASAVWEVVRPLKLWRPQDIANYWDSPRDFAHDAGHASWAQLLWWASERATDVANDDTKRQALVDAVLHSNRNPALTGIRNRIRNRLRIPIRMGVV